MASLKFQLECVTPLKYRDTSMTSSRLMYHPYRRGIFRGARSVDEIPFIANIGTPLTVRTPNYNGLLLAREDYTQEHYKQRVQREKGEKTMAKNFTTTDFENLMYGQMGLRGLKNKLIINGVEYYSNKAKDHFGIEINITQPNQVREITKWIADRDLKFKYHIANPTMNFKRNADPIINKQFILKLERATYMFVSGTVVGRNDNSDQGGELYIYLFGKKYQKWLRELSKYLRDQATQTSMMYSISAQKSDNRDSSYWTCTGSTLIPRPMSTLYFDKGIKEEIEKHLDKWEANESIYKERGLIFKTGILLYGNAGTGKSSLASAIAHRLNCALISIDMSTFAYLNISEVTESINADDDRYVILLDEIDTVFTNRDDDASTDKQRSTISKLLQFMDSQHSPTNVVFVATTNYKDRLDDALLRKGRFDKIIHLGDIDYAAALEMCKGFNLTQDQINSLNLDKNSTFNPAELQDRILSTIAHKEALENDK